MTIQENLSSQAHRAMVAAYLEATEAAVRRLSLAEVIRLLDAYQIQTLIQEFSIHERDLLPLLDEMENAAFAAGTSYTVAGVSAAAKRVPFNRRHWRAEEHIRNEGARLVRDITEGSRTSVQQAVMRGLRTGASNDKIARDLAGKYNRVTQVREGGVVGLAPVHEEWAAGAERDLSTLNPNYLTRKLRDRRYDAAFKKALAEGKPLATSEVIRMTQRYRDRLVRYRAGVIARTEAHTALNLGRYEKTLQTMEAAGLSVADIEAVWKASNDARTRDTHGALRNRVQQIGEAFRTTAGHRMRYPGDRSLGAPAEEIVNCRCTLAFRVKK